MEQYICFVIVITLITLFAVSYRIEYGNIKNKKKTKQRGQTTVQYELMLRQILMNQQAIMITLMNLSDTANSEYLNEFCLATSDLLTN